MLSRLPRVRIIGDIAIVRILDELDEEAEREIGQEILRLYPRLRAVVRLYGVKGVTRIPDAKVIAGDSNTETVYKENRCKFKLDVIKMMFCLGNLYERKRIVSLVKEGETIVDMFAGVGQFSIPIAVHSNPKIIYAFEVNPDTYAYLVKNVEENKVSGKVIPIMDDNRNAIRYGLKQSADRIIMGYFPNTINYLSHALKLCKPEGTYIHLHDLARKGYGWQNLYEECLKIVSENKYEVELVNYRMVKSYSPSMAHWVLDLLVKAPQAP